MNLLPNNLSGRPLCPTVKHSEKKIKFQTRLFIKSQEIENYYKDNNRKIACQDKESKRIE